MNVLSLFDGMSCGRITLSELGIPVEKYYASEVDKFAIKATMQNFPDTIQLGDVRELEVSRLDKIDLIIGGSPCTNLSMSGKRKGLSTKEGMEVLDLQTYLELKETKHKDCSKCSLRDLCQDEFGIACLCWISLASESEVINTEFKCRGEATDNVSVEKAIEVLSSILESWVHGGDADCVIAEFEEKLMKTK